VNPRVIGFRLAALTWWVLGVHQTMPPSGPVLHVTGGLLMLLGAAMLALGTRAPYALHARLNPGSGEFQLVWFTGNPLVPGHVLGSRCASLADGDRLAARQRPLVGMLLTAYVRGLPDHAVVALNPVEVAA
jgi:hypothetical protein